jgi:hypothetical protein
VKLFGIALSFSTGHEYYHARPMPILRNALRI